MKVKPAILLLLLAASVSCKEKISPAPVPVSPVIPGQAPGVKLVADGPGNTYELINSILGGTGNGVEDPDCAHPSFGRHIRELYDNTLNKNVFAFTLHVTPDDDRCNGATDRQRNEIKTYGPSPANVKGELNETVTYRWKFKLDAGMKPSSSFTHIHQLKAGEGTNEDAPIITITPRAGNPEKLEIIHTGNTAATTLSKVKIVDLAPFKGTWVEVIEKVSYKTSGSVDLAIKKVSDGTLLLAYTNNNIDLWRDGATFVRPKWGIYRSLNNVAALRDEEVLFADFCIAEGNTICQ